MNKIATEILFEHFKKLNETPDLTENSNNQKDDNDSSTIQDDRPFNVPFTIDEIERQTINLKNGKASGIDAIINEFIKHSPSQMISLLTKYFNLILVSSIIPSDWSLGIIIHIYKNKGNVNDPDNYRVITLLSCIGKFFTMVLNNRLSIFLEINNLLGEEHAGFQAGYSTLDHVFTLHCIIDLYISKKKKLYCAFVDYRKAFDTVDRSHLWQKVLD